MVADLTSVKDGLEELTDIELHALIMASNRRAGQHYELLPPEAAIDPSEEEVSISAVHAMRQSFASSGFAPAALKFFDALVALLTGEGRRQ